MNVTWIKCKADNWCPLETLDLESMREVSGVYIIWHEGNLHQAPWTVRVGQGAPIKTRLSAHRNDKEILAYRSIGILRVTWAAVPALQRDGIERFLGNNLQPRVGSLFPVALPLAVNYPW